MTTPTVAGTRPGGAIASAWAVMHYLGVEGYRERTRRILAARERITTALPPLGLQVYGDPRLALIAFGPRKAPDGVDDLNIFAVWKSLHDRGWFSGVVANPNGIHMMLSPSHDEVAEEYLHDLGEAVAAARGSGEDGPNPPVRYA